MAAIIFDFDGTIANSFDYLVDFIEKESGRKPLTTREKAALHGVSMAGIGRRMGVPWRKMPSLFFKGRRQMRTSMRRVEPFEGMPDVIQKLHAEGHEMFVLSTNTLHNIRKFLHYYKLHTYFLEIYGGVGMFGKAPALRRLLREQNIEVRKAIYVGDELRDVMAAQSIGLRVIAVTWGFAKSTDLKSQEATGLAHEPADIIRLLEEL